MVSSSRLIGSSELREHPTRVQWKASGSRSPQPRGGSTSRTLARLTTDRPFHFTSTKQKRKWPRQKLRWLKPISPLPCDTAEEAAVEIGESCSNKFRLGEEPRPGIGLRQQPRRRVCHGFAAGPSQPKPINVRGNRHRSRRFDCPRPHAAALRGLPRRGVPRLDHGWSQNEPQSIAGPGFE